MHQVDNLRFSFIVPVYNAEKYLRYCIDSLINQNFTNYQIILVDDGSTDNSYSICKDYSNKYDYISVIHKSNGGAVSARFCGLQNAIGEYILFVDADDWVSLDYCKFTNDLIEQFHPDIIYTCFKQVFPNEKEIIEKPPVKIGYYDKEQMKKVIYPFLIEDIKAKYVRNGLCGNAIKRKLLLKYHIKEQLRISVGEDAACFKPCVYHASSIFISDYISYYYRQNNLSITKSKNVFALDGARLIAQHYYNTIDCDNNDMQLQINRNIVHNFFNIAMSQFNSSLSYKEVKKIILKELDNSFYYNAINKCNYKCISGKIALYLLKFKLIKGIYICSKIKYR